MKARKTAADVMAALAKRHAPPAWALLEQVANGTGRHGNRYADAVAMSLWPSRGLDIHGFGNQGLPHRLAARLAGELKEVGEKPEG